MKTILTLLCFTLVNFGCKEATKKQKNYDASTLLIDFKTELAQLDKSKIHSIDDATSLFNKYVNKTASFKQKDSLFQDYFDYYTIGRTLLINADDKTISKYGFIKKSDNGKPFLVPTNSAYLNDNIIVHFSKPMQLFCQQQLKEFNAANTIEITAKNTLWWEQFNVNYPDFFLKDMTNYHYKDWHLKNLITGSQNVPVFDQENMLLDQVHKVYLDITEKHPDSQTGKIIKDYLAILEKSELKKTKEIETFFEDYQ